MSEDNFLWRSDVAVQARVQAEDDSISVHSSPLEMTEAVELSARSISARLGVLGRADGSCHWTQGDTSVMVAVWGPMAPKRAAQAMADRAFIEVRLIEEINDNVNQNSNLDGRDNPVSLKNEIYSAFKSVILDSLHPRCQISIVIQVIADAGGVRQSYAITPLLDILSAIETNNHHFSSQLLSACINATTMALIDAGVSVSGFISSATIAFPSSRPSSEGGMAVDAKEDEHDLLLDPTSEQTQSASAVLTVAWDNRGRQVYSAYKLQYDPDVPVDADEQEDKYWRAVELSKKASAKILNFQRQTIQQKVVYETSFGLPDSKAVKKE